LQLDWLTIAAQIANFLVLIWLLQRFLYTPITRAMAKREARIEERLADARKQRQEAEQEAKTLRERQQDLDARAEEVLAEARREAEALKDRLEQDLRKEFDEKRSNWQEHLEEEKTELIRQLRKRMADQVVKVVRRTLSDFANTDLATQIANEFARRLGTLEEANKSRLRAAAARPGSTAMIGSGIDLPAEARSLIAQAVHHNLGTDIKFDYRTDEDVVLGIRLTLGEEIVEWSAGSYLKKLDDLVRDTLDAAGIGSPKPEGQTNA
jgi:F-type H+-transporting ATPase subunit b